MRKANRNEPVDALGKIQALQPQPDTSFRLNEKPSCASSLLT